MEAERRGISRDVIAAAIKVPVEKAEKRIEDGSAFVKTPAGQERVALRTAMKGLAGRNLTKAQQDANNSANMKVEYHADSIIKLLRANILSWGNNTAKNAIMELHKELEKRIN